MRAPKIDKDWVMYLAGFLLLCGVLLSPIGEPTQRFLLRRSASVTKAIYSWSTSRVRPAEVSKGTEAEIELQKLRAENEALRDAMNLPPQQLKQVSAEVIAAKSGPVNRQVVISGGSKSGIKTGQAVLSAGFLVGLVNEVNSDTSSVRLISDPDFKASVNVGSSLLPGLASGDLVGLSLSRIPLNEDVKEGDIITTTSSSGNLPASLILGRIASLDSSDPIFWRGIIDSPVALDSLKFVHVVLL